MQSVDDLVCITKYLETPTLTPPFHQKRNVSEA